MGGPTSVVPTAATTAAPITRPTRRHMKTIKNETWRLRGTDLEIACVLDTPADSDRSPFNAAVYRAWVVGHEDLTTAYGESPADAREGAKVRASGVPTPDETDVMGRTARLQDAAIEALQKRVAARDAEIAAAHHAIEEAIYPREEFSNLSEAVARIREIASQVH